MEPWLGGFEKNATVRQPRIWNMEEWRAQNNQHSQVTHTIYTRTRGLRKINAYNPAADTHQLSITVNNTCTSNLRGLGQAWAPHLSVNEKLPLVCDVEKNSRPPKVRMSAPHALVGLLKDEDYDERNE